MTSGVPLPPADAALPSLGPALSLGAMRELLGPFVSGGFEIRSLAPVYIRYKPGTNCLLQYRLELEEQGGGRALETLLQAKLYPAGRAARRWSKGSLQALADSAAAWMPEAPLERAGLLPELGALFYAYPVDPDLPALGFAASPFG
ncbi:MAG: hypothetical protein M3R39_10515, partial [Actinomycetota bacterium]|nr:hypothetical protein [Actinomycetota bacterium]